MELEHTTLYVFGDNTAGILIRGINMIFDLGPMASFQKPRGPEKARIGRPHHFGLLNHKKASSLMIVPSRFPRTARYIKFGGKNGSLSVSKIRNAVL